MDNGYDLQHMEDAQHFLNFIRRTNPRWLTSGKRRSSIIFRGQPNSELTLIPSAWRIDAQFAKLFDNLKEELEFNFKQEFPHAVSLDVQINNIGNEINNGSTERINQYAWKIICELYLADEFINRANNIGLKISKLNPFGFINSPIHISSLAGQILKNKQDIKSLLNGSETIRKISLKKYYDENVSTFALAQHHGIPTRLLAWTKNPLKAAYFAIDNIDENANQIAVMALDTNSLSSYGIYVIDEFPHADFHFLHVQEGVFTYMPFCKWMVS